MNDSNGAGGIGDIVGVDGSKLGGGALDASCGGGAARLMIIRLWRGLCIYNILYD